jgi:tRNA (adenine37-N6)-methyltransferase
MKNAFSPIGTIETPYIDSAPFQPQIDDLEEFRLVLNPSFEKGLRYLETFSHIYVIYFLNRNTEHVHLTQRPHWLGNDGPEGNFGVFATRSPERPNPIGLSVVQIKKIVGNVVYTSGLDAFSGTPLLDIKPYIRDLDAKDTANNGWVDELKDREHLTLHIRGIPHRH